MRGKILRLAVIKRDAFIFFGCKHIGLSSDCVIHYARQLKQATKDQAKEDWNKQVVPEKKKWVRDE